MVRLAIMSTRVETIVQLNDDLVQLLDQRAARRRISRSQVIRELLEDSLDTDRREADTRRLVEGYERQPQSDGSDAWGDLDEWTATNTRRNRGALADEDLRPW